MRQTAVRTLRGKVRLSRGVREFRTGARHHGRGLGARRRGARLCRQARRLRAALAPPPVTTTATTTAMPTEAPADTPIETPTKSPAAVAVDVPERLGYRIKRAVLGKPLVTGQLHEERLSKKTALGVLSSDCISSSAYGTEEMLIFLLPAFGLAGFRLVMPMTFVVLAVLLIMTALYRQVVMIYTKAGGSYVVARENFGPKIAQIASVALLIDYIVTVAVQSAAGTAALVTLVPALHSFAEPMTIGIVLILAFGNLRGVREAGKAFAFPTYFFVGMMGLVMIVGLLRELMGDLPQVQHEAG